MIENSNVINEVQNAIDNLDAIAYVMHRDGFISEKYVMEKVREAKWVCNWLEALCEGDE